MCCFISLRCKVLSIAIGCMCCYLISVSLQICIISSSNFKNMFDKNQEYTMVYNILLSVIVLSFCGLFTCILFILGVFQKKKALILPFMIFSETILACVIILELVCDIITPLYGLILLFFIPPIVYTVVTTRAFYYGITGNNSSSSKCNGEEDPENIKALPLATILTKY